MKYLGVLGAVSTLQAEGLWLAERPLEDAVTSHGGSLSFLEGATPLAAAPISGSFLNLHLEAGALKVNLDGPSDPIEKTLKEKVLEVLMTPSVDVEKSEAEAITLDKCRNPDETFVFPSIDEPTPSADFVKFIKAVTSTTTDSKAVAKYLKADNKYLNADKDGCEAKAITAFEELEKMEQYEVVKGMVSDKQSSGGDSNAATFRTIFDEKEFVDKHCKDTDLSADKQTVCEFLRVVIKFEKQEYILHATANLAKQKKFTTSAIVTNKLRKLLEPIVKTDAWTKTKYELTDGPIGPICDDALGKLGKWRDLFTNKVKAVAEAIVDKLPNEAELPKPIAKEDIKVDDDTITKIIKKACVGPGLETLKTACGADPGQACDDAIKGAIEASFTLLGSAKKQEVCEGDEDKKWDTLAQLIHDPSLIEGLEDLTPSLESAVKISCEQSSTETTSSTAAPPPSTVTPGARVRKACANAAQTESCKETVLAEIQILKTEQSVQDACKITDDPKKRLDAFFNAIDPTLIVGDLKIEEDGLLEELGKICINDVDVQSANQPPNNQ